MSMTLNRLRFHNILVRELGAAIIGLLIALLTRGGL